MERRVLIGLVLIAGLAGAAGENMVGGFTRYHANDTYDNDDAVGTILECAYQSDIAGRKTPWN